MALSLSYSVRNLAARRIRTLLTIGGVALVVCASTLFLGLIHSLETSLVATGHPRNLVVMRKGADNDGSSELSLEAFQAVRFFEGIERSPDGEPLASPETVVQPFFTTRSGVRENVLVRGVEAPAFAVHDEVSVVEGRRFEPSSREVIVGRGVADRYADAGLGSELSFGRGSWKVVGVFEAGGSSLESEVWADARVVAQDARRILPYSGFRVRAASGTDLEALGRRISEDQRFGLQAKPETQYYAELSQTADSLYLIVVGIALLAGTGAIFGASNTLYASVQARTSEVGTLRALGFSRGAIARAFLVEALLIAVAGFALGVLLTWGLAAFVNTSMNGVGFPSSTFTTTVVSLRVTPADLLLGLGLGLAIGLIGGFAPALRASRLQPLDALRRA